MTMPTLNVLVTRCAVVLAVPMLLAMAACSPQKSNSTGLKQDSRKGAVITTKPGERPDRPDDSRPVTLNAGGGSAAKSGTSAAQDESSTTNSGSSGSTGPASTTRPASGGPKLGSGRSMDDTPATAAPATPPSTSPQPPATTAKSLAGPTPTPAPAVAKADAAIIARVRELAFKAFADGSYATARELALEVVAHRDTDAEAHLLIARAVAAEYPKHVGDADVQESLAKQAADGARNAWKHGKQDLSIYQAAEFQNLTNAPAWIGVIGELKARNERKALGK